MTAIMRMIVTKKEGSPCFLGGWQGRYAPLPEVASYQETLVQKLWMSDTVLLVLSDYCPDIGQLHLMILPRDICAENTNFQIFKFVRKKSINGWLSVFKKVWARKLRVVTPYLTIPVSSSIVTKQVIPIFFGGQLLQPEVIAALYKNFLLESK